MFSEDFCPFFFAFGPTPVLLPEAGDVSAVASVF